MSEKEFNEKQDTKEDSEQEILSRKKEAIISREIENFINRVEERLQANMNLKKQNPTPLEILQRESYFLKEARESFCDSNTVILGDTNGSITMVKDQLGIAGISLEKDSKKREVVLIGDILADRIEEGGEILTHCYDLRKHGYDIHLTIGNHDDWFISYLFNYHSHSGDPMVTVVSCLMQNQGAGLKEIIDPSYDEVSWESLLCQPERLRRAFLDRSTIPGSKEYKMLHEIGLMEFYRIDKEKRTLYLHTHPTSKILNKILENIVLHEKWSVTVNDIQKDESLREDDGLEKTSIDALYFEYASIFTNTHTRSETKDPVVIKEFKLISNVDTIIFGHSREPKIDVTTKIFKDEGLKLLNIDGGSHPSSPEALSLLCIRDTNTFLGSKSRGIFDYIYKKVL